MLELIEKYHTQSLFEAIVTMYKKIGSDLVVGSDINYIVDYYQINNLQYTLNKKAACYLLRYCFMLEDNTIFSQINKLIAGHYILIENGKWVLSNTIS